MFIRQHWLSLTGLVLSTALLFGCSNSSSSSSSKAEADFPFQAEALVVTNDFDGDGNWDVKATTTYVYNADMQAVEQTIVEEYDADADGVADSKDVEVTTFDPAITTAIAAPKAAKVAAGPEFDDFSMGAVTSVIYQEFDANPETGLPFSHPSYQREYTYTYTADGTLTERTSTRTYDDNSDGTPESSSFASYRYEYNAAGEQTRYEYISSADDNGDGVADSRSTDITLREYDTHGNLTRVSETDSTDTDGDGTAESTGTSETTYSHTYTDDKLTRTVVASDVRTYTIDYTYNAQGRLQTKVESRDENLDNDIADAFYSYTYSYDEAGRQTSELFRYEYDSDENDEIDYFFDCLKQWTYNSAGLISLYVHTDRYDYTPAEALLSGHYKSSDAYEYDGNLLTSHIRSYYRDVELDGEIDFAYRIQAKTFTYENGNLASYSDSFTYDDEGNVPPATQDLCLNTFVYDNGVLVSQIHEDDNDGDGTFDRNETITSTYNEAGLLTQLNAEEDIDNDSSIDSTETLNFAYNEDNTVTITSLSSNADGEQAGPIALSYDFGSQTIPTGTMPYTFESVTVDYPAAGSNQIITGVQIEDSPEDKTYLMTVPLPKVLGLYYYLQFDD